MRKIRLNKKIEDKYLGDDNGQWPAYMFFFFLLNPQCIYISYISPRDFARLNLANEAKRVYIIEGKKRRKREYIQLVPPKVSIHGILSLIVLES